MSVHTGGAPFEPVIVGFLCEWCAYRAADLAGMTRMHYAPNMRAIRVMCTGRVEPEFVLKALRDGADGVLVVGCHPGECHYVDGNVKALRRFSLLRATLLQFGIERERVQLVWSGASEGGLLAEAVNRMTEELKSLGPLGLSAGPGTAPPNEDREEPEGLPEGVGS